MAFTELEKREIQRELDSFIDKIRPPQKIRAKFDYGYKIENQSIEIYEIRSEMENKKMNNSFAKTKYDRKNNKWKLYWMRADLKWHSYEPESESSSLENVLKIVQEDEYCCFLDKKY